MNIFKPPHFSAQSKEEEIQFIKDNAFASLITAHENAVHCISKLPLMIKQDLDNIFLEGHIAKANPHVQALQKNSSVTLIFDGAHGYISPTWYTKPTQNVPTWNYKTVIVEGTASLITDLDWAKRSVLELSEKFEKSSTWKKSVNKDYLTSLLPGIVGVQIEVQTLTAKFKLSQNRSEQERAQLIEGLQESQLAIEMKKLSKGKTG